MLPFRKRTIGAMMPVLHSLLLTLLDSTLRGPAGAGAPRIRRHVQVLDHVVGVIDLGETPTGLLYLVMKYFEGRRRSLM
jgi:hypothetical protein